MPKSSASSVYFELECLVNALEIDLETVNSNFDHKISPLVPLYIVSTLAKRQAKADRPRCTVYHRRVNMSETNDNLLSPGLASAARQAIDK